MQFNIIGTGSSGNCFLINDDLMIDAGMPYSKIKDYVKNVKYVLLTHIHGDHYNPATIRKLIVDIDPIFICGDFLEDELLKIADNDKIIAVEENKVYELNNYKISPVSLYHDVKNFGYRIMHNGYKHFHATDTSTLEGIEAKNYDSASIECNHDRNKALELIEEAKINGEFSHLQGAINSHLSVDKTIQFCKENHIKKLYPVHIGSSTKKEVVEALKRW